MELIFKIIGVGLVTCIAVLILKPVRADFAMIISLVGGVIILVMILSSVTSAISLITSIADRTGVNSNLLALVFKIIGVGYLAEFSASLCADAGSSGLGEKILLGGKIVILIMAIPIVTSIINIVLELLPT